MKENRMPDIKKIREAKGLSRREVADVSGINLRSLQDYEQGHKDITSAKAETVYRLSLALGCTMEELMGIRPALPESEGRWTRKGKSRLYAYSVEFLKLQDRMKAQEIYSSRHHVHGRWEIHGEECILAFCFRGEIVRIPFEAVFSEKTLPWLVDVAEMRMDHYIEELLFQEKYGRGGGKLWDE
ncbi:helix-turn-helix domain-containing protein [Bariatricus sp. SGI.154]|uniref:helix-turn-helix domain-containing protein n=1 Tax=Bariatricus sp. SGI.154 TaxID=3420549 RepID=UPI003D03F943